MAATIAQVVYTARDNRGRTRTLKTYVAYTTGATDTLETVAGGLLPLIQACSNAAWKLNIGTPSTLAYGATAQFDSVVDKAMMVFQDTNGNLHRYNIVAPLLSIFKTDQVTVDPANVNVSAFTAYMIANARSRDQVLLGTFVGGVRRTGKLPKRLNIFILEPGGAYPAE